MSGIGRAKWLEQARCVGQLELFYPAPGTRGARKAKAICAQCPVRAQCLEWAMESGERFGVWGGLSERERVVLRHGGRVRALAS